MKTIKLLLLTFFISSISLASDFPDNPFFKFLIPNSDSGIRGPEWEVMVSNLNNLANDNSTLAKVIYYGKTLENRDLVLMKIANSAITKPNSPAIYIGGAIHGDEYLNIEDRLPAWFLAQAKIKSSVKDFLDLGGAIYIAPILNPDGYAHRERENSHGVDLNRDYTVIKADITGFKEPETNFLINFLKSDLALDKRSLKVALDYHCCIGALLYPWSFTGPKIPSKDKEAHVKIGKIMQQALGTKIKYGRTPDLLGYDARGTSKDFYYEHFNALGFTYEGRYQEENKFFPEHTKMWSNILQEIIN